ncbi:MAG: monovalent cation/H+ antiporter subunit D family protein [Proteobacteria bacterium]|nr:monovalent cation/H+ antiporter subunit D family protein [Pseudomonadota bacterium]
MSGPASETLVLLALGLPALGAVGIAITGRIANLREAVTLSAAGATFAVVTTLLLRVLDGERPAAGGWEVFGGIEIAFAVEPLGMIFGMVASGLWIVNSIYSIGYMRANDEPRQTPFYICFAVAISSAIGIAFSGNLLTLFLFYEILTISTYPLVTHRGTDEARTKGRVYLLLLMATSMVLLLPAVIWTWVAAGTLDFTPGGILAAAGLSGGAVGLLLALYIFGIGKAAVMPVHFWLPAAMVAPTPVSALLHAVAVVKAGVFTVVKVIVYIFGIDFLAASGANQWLIYVAGTTIILASLIAMTKDNLKARLAYSTISQLGYVVVGALLATPYGIIGSGMHIAMHAVGKITLFFCAGAIYTAARKTKVSELAGLGRRMPFTFAAFLIASLSIIGLPPLGGLWSKWYLALGALDAGQFFVLAALMLSSLLNVAYLLPIPFRAFFGNEAPDAGQPGEPAGAEAPGGTIREAPLACLIAIGLTALGCVALFFFPGPLLDLLTQIPLR